MLRRVTFGLILLMSLLAALFCDFELFSGEIEASLADDYDFIVVGAGSAGCILSRRLSDLPGARVLLLEAGPRPSLFQRFLSDTPILVPLTIGSAMDWFHATTPQRHAAHMLKENKVILPAGKIVGGTAMINAMIVSRGHPEDYDNWDIPGWAFDDVKGFLEPRAQGVRISEQMLATGPVVKDLSLSILEAANASGYTTSQTGFDGWSHLGFTTPLVNLRNGRRSTTYSAYLEQRPPSRLRIVDKAFVRRVRLDASRTRVEAVELERRGKRHSVRLRPQGEVVLSAGSMSSPTILLRSGIGDAEELQNEHKISPQVNVSGVGRNFHDHPMLALYATINSSSTITVRKIANPIEIVKYILWKEGLWTHASGLVTIGYLQTPYQRLSGSSVPDIQYYIVGVGSIDFGLFKRVANYRDDAWRAFIPPRYRTSDEGFIITTVLLNPKSRGRVSLNPEDSSTPHIDPNYFSHPDDVARLREGVRMIVRMLNGSQRLQELGTQIHFPDYSQCREFPAASSEYIDCLIRGSSLTVYHPVGSCRFGRKEDLSTPLDPDLKVRGVENLRVVDASVFPTAPSGNPNTPVTMVAETISHRIARTWQDRKDK